MEKKRHINRGSAALQKKVKRLTAWLTVMCVLAVCFGACAAYLAIQNKKLKDIPAAAEAVPELPAAADGIVAEFDGGVITAAEAAEEYEMLTTYYRLLGMDEAEYAEEAKQEVVDGLIEEKLLQIKAQEMGCFDLSEEQRAALEAQVRQEYEDNIEYYREFRYDESKTDDEIRQETIDFLNESGLSYEELLTEAGQNAWRDNLYQAVTKDLSIDETQLKEFYDAQVTSDEMAYSASFSEYELDADAGRTIVWHPEGVRRIDSVLIPFDEDQMSAFFAFQSELGEGAAEHLEDLDALYDALMPTAEDAVSRLKAGESFEALQAEFGTLNDSGSYVGAQSQLYGDDFRVAAMGLGNIGDISEPVRTDLGVCILRYAGDVAPGVVDFESVKDSLRANYEQEIRSSQYNDTVMRWIAEANVVYHPENF